MFDITDETVNENIAKEPGLMMFNQHKSKTMSDAFRVLRDDLINSRTRGWSHPHGMKKIDSIFHFIA